VPTFVELGFSDIVLDTDHLLLAPAGTLPDVIERLANNAPLSLKAMKALIVRQMAFRNGIAHGDVDKLVETVRRSQDAQEGMAARLARRQPQFKGR